jgi:hypothetical protein
MFYTLFFTLSSIQQYLAISLNTLERFSSETPVQLCIVINQTPKIWVNFQLTLLNSICAFINYAAHLLELFICNLNNKYKYQREVAMILEVF